MKQSRIQWAWCTFISTIRTSIQSFFVYCRLISIPSSSTASLSRSSSSSPPSISLHPRPQINAILSINCAHIHLHHLPKPIAPTPLHHLLRKWGYSGCHVFEDGAPKVQAGQNVKYIELAQLGQMKHMHQHSKHSDDFGTHNILCQHLRPFRHVCAYYQLISVFDADFHHSNGFRCRMKTVKGQVAEEGVGFHRGWETETTIL